VTAAFVVASGLVSRGAEPGLLASGKGRFEFTHAGKTVPVWYYIPQDAPPLAPILFVMHGVKRNADHYRDDWAPHAQKRGFIVVAPEFSSEAFPGSAYNYGGTVDAQGRPRPRAQWTFSLLEPIFDAIQARTGNRSARYHLYGHSAGAQFVHRYTFFVPSARVAMAVAANAGWWTMPDLSVDFPYGLRGSGLDEVALKASLQRPLTVLLGTADTDPNHPELRRTPEAMAQGPHRLARGKLFYATGEKQAAALGVAFGWKLAFAPEIAHEDKGMAPFAVESLFGKPADGER
jgi:poly(3-hydroxybutyrate) depolymerase